MPSFVTGAIAGLSAIWLSEFAGVILGQVALVSGHARLSAPENCMPPAFQTRRRGTDVTRRGAFARRERLVGPHAAVSGGFTQRPQMRGVGALARDGIVIALSASNSMDNSQADVQCHRARRYWLARRQVFTEIPNG